jgi:hypothetical protein
MDLKGVPSQGLEGRDQNELVITAVEAAGYDVVVVGDVVDDGVYGWGRRRGRHRCPRLSELGPGVGNFRPGHREALTPLRAFCRLRNLRRLQVQLVGLKRVGD